MNKNEIVKTLVVKYGVVDTLRFYLRGVHDSANSMKMGVAEGNNMLAVKDLEALVDNLQYIETIINDKDNRPAINGLEKNLK